MKGNIQVQLLILFFLTGGLLHSEARSQSGFDRNAFYNAMSGKSLESINDQLEVLKNSDVSGKQAFEGALMAKKAALLSKPNEKLKSFKAGAGNLEKAISADQENTEYRFLRLMIQEHAPKIVHYNGDKDKDGKFIRDNYSKLSDEMKKIVKNYSKNSKILKPEDLN